MSTTALWVLVVVLPASAAALVVLALDVSARRRRLRPIAAPSRLTALLGASLGAGGFGLASIAGLGPTAHAHGPEQVWVATATPGGGVAVAPVDPAALVQLPYAPVAIWGTGFDGAGTWEILAGPAGDTGLAGAAGTPLASGDWPKVGGEGVRALGLVDPAAIVAAARAAGVLPENGVYTLVLRTPDPPARAVFTLAAPPAPAAPPPARSNGVPPITGATASAVQRRPGAAAPAAAAPAPATPAPGSIGIPGTGGGAPLIGGLAMLLAGGACAGVALRLRRGPA